MGCNCKKKKPLPPEPVPANIVFVEDGQVKIKPRPPEPIQTPDQQALNVEKIVDKLHEIINNS